MSNVSQFNFRRLVAADTSGAWWFHIKLRWKQSGITFRKSFFFKLVNRKKWRSNFLYNFRFDNESRKLESIGGWKQIKQRKRLFKLVLRGKGETGRENSCFLTMLLTFQFCLNKNNLLWRLSRGSFASHYLKPFSFNISSFVPRLQSHTRFCFVFWHKIWQNSRIPVSSFLQNWKKNSVAGVCQWRLGNSYQDRNCLWILLRVD